MSDDVRQLSGWRSVRTAGRLFVIVLAAVVSGIGVARAQQLTTASVHVAFTGPVGTAASIELSSAETRRRWSVLVNNGRAATAQRLPAGTYTLTVAIVNGRSASTTVSLDAGSVTRFSATLSGGADMPAVALIGRRQVGQGARFDATMLRDVPAGGSLNALLDTAAPFVMADRFDNGGLATAQFARAGARGASWTSTALSLDGLDVGPPTSSGAFAFYPDMHALEHVSVTSGMLPADVGTAGIDISLVPRRPGSTRHASVDASFSTPRMVSNGSSKFGAPPIAAMTNWRDVNVQAGGPIASRAGGFLSATRTHAESTERERASVSIADVISLFGHLVVRPTTRDEVRVVGALQRLSHDFDGRWQFANPDVQQKDALGLGQMSWDRQYGNGSQSAVAIGVERSTLTPDVVASAAGGTVDRVFDGLMPAPARVTTMRRVNARAEFNPAVRGRFSDVRAVLTVARTSTSSHLLALPTVAETVGRVAARAWVPTDPGVDSERHITDVAFSLGTSIPLTTHATVDAGVRAEMSRGAALGATQSIAWTTLSPRVSFRWAPALVTVYGGASRYHARLTPALLAFGDPGEPVFDVRRWQDVNGNGRLENGELGPLVAVAGRHPSIASIDPGLKAPVTDEFTLGLERNLTQTLFVRTTAVVRRNRSIPRSVDVGTPPSSYIVFTVPDGNTSIAVGERPLNVFNRTPASFGQDRYLLTNVADDTSTYGGIEIEGGLRTTRWMSTAGVSAYRADGSGGNRGFRVDENDQGVIGELFEDPNATTNSTGRLFFDRAYLLKWSTTFHTANQWLTAVTARYQDGQPFSRLVLVRELSQGAEAISADTLGSTRFTFNVTVDARIEKRFSMGSSRMAVRVDLFNLLNHGNEVEEDPIAGAGFRRTTAAQPPRTIRLGLRLEY